MDLIFVAPQKVIIDKAMDKEIELLKKKLKERDSEILELQKEVVKLKRALSVQAVKSLNDL